MFSNFTENQQIELGMMRLKVLCVHDCFSHQHHSITIQHDPNIHSFIQNCLLSQYCFFSDVIVESNVREVKVHSPDYKGVEADEVFLFFLFFRNWSKQY